MKTFNYFFFLIFLFAAGLSLHAQVIDATPIIASEKNTKTEEVHSPKKAVMYSAILPGLGQAYNKKYWKIPIVYAGLGTVGYFIVWNNNNYKLIKTAYIDLSEYSNPDHTGTAYLKLKGIEYYDLDNPGHIEILKTALIKYQSYYRRNRDLLIISMFGVYALNIIDASVDAHLFNFDISDNLSMNWQPSMLRINNELAYSINLSFKF